MNEKITRTVPLLKPNYTFFFYVMDVDVISFTTGGFCGVLSEGGNVFLAE